MRVDNRLTKRVFIFSLSFNDIFRNCLDRCRFFKVLSLTDFPFALFVFCPKPLFFISWSTSKLSMDFPFALFGFAPKPSLFIFWSTGKLRWLSTFSFFSSETFLTAALSSCFTDELIFRGAWLSFAVVNLNFVRPKAREQAYA